MRLHSGRVSGCCSFMRQGDIKFDSHQRVSGTESFKKYGACIFKMSAGEKLTDL